MSAAQRENQHIPQNYQPTFDQGLFLAARDRNFITLAGSLRRTIFSYYSYAV